LEYLKSICNAYILLLDQLLSNTSKGFRDNSKPRGLLMVSFLLRLTLWIILVGHDKDQTLAFLLKWSAVCEITFQICTDVVPGQFQNCGNLPDLLGPSSLLAPFKWIALGHNIQVDRLCH